MPCFGTGFLYLYGVIQMVTRKLFFVGFTKVLYMAFGNHLRIVLMTLVVDNVEEEWLCHAVNLDFIITHINPLLRNISLKHRREHSAYTHRHPLSTENILLSLDVDSFRRLSFV